MVEALTTLADIRSIRLSRGLSQRELALRSMVEQGDLRRWERGLELPPDGALTKIASALEIKPELLRRGQERLSESVTPGEGYTTAQPDEKGVIPRTAAIPSNRHRVLDLFCGSGGFSYGFEMTDGFAVTAGVDLLPDRANTFRANHRAATAIVDDIREVSMGVLSDASEQPDVIIGGPPCQGFSSIRPFRTLTEGDPRNNLFEHFALVVATLRPRWFVLENVVGLLTHSGGAALPQLLDSLRVAGYTLEHRVVNAANFGLPQNRERFVVIGNREGRRFEWPQPTHHTNHRSMAGTRAPRLHLDPLFCTLPQSAVTVMEAIHDLPAIGAGEEATDYDLSVTLTKFEEMMRDQSPGLTLHQATSHTPRMLEIIRLAGSNRGALPEGMTNSGFSSSYSRLAPDSPSVTLTVNFVHPASNKCIHPYQNRALTPREGARLQGFPDRFKFVGTRAQIVKQIGNAVPPLLGQAIAQALLDQW